MARRTNYVRDARGRFSSTPGGGGLGAARKAKSPGARRKAGATAGGTLAARSSLKASRAKAADFAASPQQRGAATRASRKLAAVKTESRRTGLKPTAGVIGGAAAKKGVKLARQERSQAGMQALKAAKKAKTATDRGVAFSQGAKSRGAKMLRDFQASGQKAAITPPAPKSKATKSTKASPKIDAKAKAMAERQAKARKIKEMVNRTGVIRGKNFNDGKDVSTMSMAEMRKAVRQMFKSSGVTTRKDFKFVTQQNPPTTRSGWEKIYKQFVNLPASERNRRARPGVINGIDIQKNFRPWAVFGLNPKTATTADIQSAFRRVAKQVHPDMGGRPKDLDRVRKMRDSILAMRAADTSPSQSKGKSKAKASSPTSSTPRPGGPLLLPPAKTTAKPKRRRGKT